MSGKESAQIQQNQYLHIHKSLGQHKIIHEIGKYDYGLCTSSFDYTIYNAAFTALGAGNKTASYFEAGIPCLFGPCAFPEDHECTRAKLRKYNLDLWFTDHELNSLGKKLKKYDYKRLIKSVAEAREDFRMEKHIHEFETFLREVMIYKSSRKKYASRRGS